MSNKLEAAVHGNAWDALDEFSDTNTSKSDFRTAIISLGGIFDLAAARMLTKKQIDLIVRASHTDESEDEQGELNALKAYQKARRKLASEARPADDEKAQQELIRQVISDGIGDLVTISGENSRDHGFHEDFPQSPDACFGNCHEDHKTDYRRAIVEKLALQHEEISESLGEIRSGRHPLEIYFVDKKGLIGAKDAEYRNQAYGVVAEGSATHYTFGEKRWDGDIPLLKPEGFLVEQADAIIRIADLAFLVDGRERLIEALEIKHEYNSTRPYKHGRKF